MKAKNQENKKSNTELISILLHYRKFLINPSWQTVVYKPVTTKREMYNENDCKQKWNVSASTGKPQIKLFLRTEDDWPNSSRYISISTSVWLVKGR